jgi:hypothetical protein
MRVVIEENNMATDLPCGICEKIVALDTGLGIYTIDDANLPICDECAAEHCPSLFYLIRVKRAVENAAHDRFMFAIEETIFRVKPNRKRRHELKNAEPQPPCIQF